MKFSNKILTVVNSINLVIRRTLQIAMLIFVGVGTANAALHDRGNGLIYDDVLDVTWLQDANYALTADYDFSDGTADGNMTLALAKELVDNLEYGGYSDWRLPSIAFDDVNADGLPDCAISLEDIRSACSDNDIAEMSEVGYMLYKNLNNGRGLYSTNVNATFIDASSGEEKSILNLADSGNTGYWSQKNEVENDAELDDTAENEWVLNSVTGTPTKTSIDNHYITWAVRDGDVNISYGRFMSGGSNTTMVIKKNGELWGWGQNYLGQLGDGTREDKATPTLIDAVSDITAISVGHEHTLAIKSNGELWGWGHNRYGKLGVAIGKANYKYDEPVQLNFTDAKEVIADFWNSIALKNDGTVWSWGYNVYGAVGDGTTINAEIPTQVETLTDVVSIGTGQHTSFAIKSDGTLWGWGRNIAGQLGLGHTTDQYTPTQISDLSDVVEVKGGYSHTLALKSDGTVWAWGVNSNYQAGQPDNTSIVLTPLQVSSLTDVISIAAGYNHSMALKSDGTVWVWGGNSWGSLGLGYTSSREAEPVKISNIDNAVAIQTLHGTSLVLLSTGELLTFGSNRKSQTGNAGTDDVLTPYTALTGILDDE